MSIFTHPTTCAFNQEGPCTCGYQDFIDECRADENKEIIDQIMAEEEQEETNETHERQDAKERINLVELINMHSLLHRL